MNLSIILLLTLVQQRTPPILQEPQTIPLWTDRAPGALGNSDEDKPTLTIYMPNNTTGPMTAVIIAPGGAYQRLSMNLEGREPANYFNAMGIAAFVLKYRLGPKYHHPVELGDAQRAIRMVRARAAEWHMDSTRIGIMGFSAGGHLATTASTHFDSGNAKAADPIDRASSRPDFAILCYPVISMTESWTHQGSKQNLLGENPSPELARSMSTDTQVTPESPPTFIYQTNADTSVPAENAVTYYLALRKAGVPAEMHIFRNGPHGTGLGLTDPALAEWPKLLANWLRASGFLEPAGTPSRLVQPKRFDAGVHR
jgi:acetyl esterase/lipase